MYEFGVNRLETWKGYFKKSIKRGESHCKKIAFNISFRWEYSRIHSQNAKSQTISDFCRTVFNLWSFGSKLQNIYQKFFVIPKINAKTVHVNRMNAKN